MLPPTSQLPPIKYISNYPIESLESALRFLRLIYIPNVRGSRRRKPKNPGSASEELATLQSDPFERSYAIKWLTALITQCGTTEEEEEAEAKPFTQTKQNLVEEAAAILAMCAGTASAGVITRQFVFEGESSVTIELTDVPLDNQDYGSVGAQTWGGACIMAEMIVENPLDFGLGISPLRCLELGAGTGLVSLTVAKMLERLGSSDADIVATDYYPVVLENLRRNSARNLVPDGVHVTSKFLDWSTFCNADVIPDPIFEGGFDVIYGADIIYEALHATWIKSCLERLLCKPSTRRPDPIFHLLIPLRATHAVESSTIEMVFSRGEQDQALVVKHKEIIVCDAESGKEGEEVEYAYYKIGWS
ncbi:hypothetical protein M413DRAFT_440742 [Hebeloma cylindrosporum]|uniref:FAM86 N-terminal domain-containing protein n=1 Tax=Hebeloma cylindrosporum TaxID=76867 RepID=A0A0C3CTT8_HEBCY|nr:hypothetical protein M413DRAFT_440742 [Hebeloma cylindrosporum h7]